MMIGVIRQQTGSYTWGLYFVAGLLTISALIVLILSAGRVNRKRQNSLILILINRRIYYA